MVKIQAILFKNLEIETFEVFLTETIFTYFKKEAIKKAKRYKYGKGKIRKKVKFESELVQVPVDNFEL